MKKGIRLTLFLVNFQQVVEARHFCRRFAEILYCSGEVKDDNERGVTLVGCFLHIDPTRL
ncbi:hypothetical protein C5C18_14695 [Rathayibacter tritici]|uniref:hypothetical protein n=1 Tax=Rathayibacter tritici TaxID=33888 RepID=UPI000CE928E5|nr:hypothetical protein [Rathayibacter tritici]PPG02206.1 hypothetical protein C5C18_14695 [Rathayibacter tritici]